MRETSSEGARSEEEMETTSGCDGGQEGWLDKQAALLILGLKEKFKLTQVAIDGILEGATGLFQVSCMRLYIYSPAPCEVPP